jgi:hypothetical protein
METTEQAANWYKLTSSSVGEQKVFLLVWRGWRRTKQRKRQSQLLSLFCSLLFQTTNICCLCLPSFVHSRLEKVCFFSFWLTVQISTDCVVCWNRKALPVFVFSYFFFFSFQPNSGVEEFNWLAQCPLSWLCLPQCRSASTLLIIYSCYFV